MPTGIALSTTKRKFHKILDSISNASSTSLATKSNHDKYNTSTTTLPATMDPPAKKPRIARPASAYVPPSTRILASQSPNLRAAAATAKEPTPSTATMNEERKTPNFAPWDRGQFLERLKTYRHVDKWMGKPERINEVQWAKRGWSCVGKERVGCVGGCGREVVITLESSREERQDSEETQDTEKRPLDEEEDEDEWREKAQEQLVDKYAEMVVTSHDGGCLWRRKGCDGMHDTFPTAVANALMNPADTIQRLPLAHHKTAIDDLRQRYDSLVAIASELPPDPSTPEGFDLPSISQKLNPLLHPPSPDRPSTTPPTPPNPQSTTTTTTTNTPPTPITTNTSALALALFGWHAEAGHVIGLATCPACFRRLGLWLFKPSSSSLPSPSSPHSQSQSQSSMHRLDLVSEHRDYCPWTNARAQNGTTTPRDALPGWQALLRAVDAGVLHFRHGDGERRAVAREGDGEGEGVEGGGEGEGEGVEMAGREEEGVARDERDRERWAKLKRLKQAFHVRRRKGKGGGEVG
ncbi:hypothetical protein IMSHALPRED_005621 [Imshaugia aleurites]|uniref:Zf-C3HC-domain-containing protein n=1 Tax=Imshaugia aleurites TaxID=172621 RepID=A0A8H3FET6_9LECA|nr:hypothetical protein IMSHALPRED_005621 [Imshaugia aleurites]